MLAFFRGLPKGLVIFLGALQCISLVIALLMGVGFLAALAVVFTTSLVIFLGLLTLYCVLMGYSIRTAVFGGALAIILLSAIGHYTPWEEIPSFLATVLGLGLIAGLIGAGAYAYTKVPDAHQPAVKTWLLDNWWVLVLGILPPLAIIAFFGGEGAKLVFGLPFLVIWIVIIAISSRLGWGFALAPVILTMLVAGYLSIHEMTLKQGGARFASLFKAGEKFTKDGIAEDIKSVEKVLAAVQPGAGIEKGPSAPPAVTTRSVVTVPLFNHGFSPNSLCGINPCINPGKAPYEPLKVNYGTDTNKPQVPTYPSAPKAEKNEPVKKAKIEIWKPRSGTTTEGEKPLPKDACIRAKSGKPDIRHDLANSRVPIFDTWTKVSYYADIYRWDDRGHIFPLRNRTSNEPAEIEVADRCPAA